MLKRLLMLSLLAAAALSGTACNRLREEAEVMVHDEAVLLIRAESARRRPGYREVVNRFYPAIAEDRSREWAVVFKSPRARTTIR